MKTKILFSLILVAIFATVLSYEGKAVTAESAHSAPITFPITYPNPKLKSTVDGTVSRYTGAGYSSVMVIATLQGTSTQYSAITDAQGNYLIKLIPGTYTVSPSNGAAYIPASRTVIIADFSVSGVDFKEIAPVAMKAAK